jgi:hypothetical protein
LEDFFFCMGFYIYLNFHNSFFCLKILFHVNGEATVGEKENLRISSFLIWVGTYLFSKYGDCGDLGPFFLPPKRKLPFVAFHTFLFCSPGSRPQKKKALLWEPGTGSVPVCANF